VASIFVLPSECCAWRSLTVCALALVALATLLGAQRPALAAATSSSWHESPTHAIGLKEALSYAQAHQPSLRAALDRVSVAQADAQVPRAAWLPRAGAVAEIFGGTTNNTTASYVNVPDVALPRIGATRATDVGAWSPSPSTLAAVSVDQELFDFGRIASQSSAADAVVKIVSQQAELERLELALVVKESYFAVQGAKAVLRAAQDGYERTRLHRDWAEAGVKSGLFAPVERTRAEADLARFDVNRMRAEGGVAGTQTLLAAAVGSPERMLDVEDADIAVPPLPPLDQAFADAAAHDPAVLAARARLESEQAVTRAIGAETRPDLLLVGGFSTRAGGATPSSGPETRFGGWLPDVPNWDVGLLLHWPIYDGVASARQRASSARERALQSDLDSVLQQEVAAVERAYVDAQVARAALDALQRSVEAAHANYAQSEARFKAGLGTALELADAESLRTDAEIQLAGGRFALARARAVLARLLAEES
jgi:outer membrane protein